VAASADDSRGLRHLRKPLILPGSSDHRRAGGSPTTTKREHETMTTRMNSTRTRTTVITVAVLILIAALAVYLFVVQGADMGVLLPTTLGK